VDLPEEMRPATTTCSGASNRTITCRTLSAVASPH